jgi:hypothetical protein
MFQTSLFVKHVHQTISPILIYDSNMILRVMLPTQAFESHDKERYSSMLLGLADKSRTGYLYPTSAPEVLRLPFPFDKACERAYWS